MSSSNTDSENSFEYEDSDGCYVSEYDIAFENGDLNDTRVTPSKSEESVDSLDQIYADEPMADEDWMKAYEKEQEENAKLERMLEERLNGTTRVDVWCLCGNCDRQLLQNLSECYCCKELEGCKEALDTELVVRDIQPNVKLQCITQHPGFRPVCLEKWSLRMAADRFRTKSKAKYKETGSEERYLRSIAYREFSRLVYGFLGNKRIPLPACAYTKIRKQFPAAEEETFTGFDLDEEH